MSMDFKINAPKVHNRFDIYQNGKQVAYAENIILDTMWARLCAGGYPFLYIQYGTGTGTLDKTRTTLFTYLGSKSVTLVERTYANPTSLLRQSIELGLTDNNGSVLTEVGISYSSGNANLLTHAMLRDMNGNPISITKTAVDILTIYGTLYAVMDDTHATLKMLNADNNALVKQILGVSAPTNSVVAGENGEAITWPLGLASSSLGTTSTTGTWTADNANKRRTLATPRFNINDANGHIQELLFSEVARITLPASGIFAGLDIAGASVGAGDGIVKRFYLPSRNVRANTVAIKVDGAVKTNLTKYAINHNWSITTGIGQPIGAPVALSDNGICLVTYANIGGPTYYGVHRLIRGAYVRYYPAGFSYNGTSIMGVSGDGNLLVNNNIVCEWTGTTYAVNEAKAISTSVSGLKNIKINTDGTIVTYFFASSVVTHVWGGSAWSTRTSPTISNVVNGVMSADGNRIALALSSSPYVIVYDWSGSAWVARANPSELPTGASKECDISADGLILLAVSQVSPYITLYDWTGGAWVKRTVLPSSLPTDIRGCAISSSGTRIMVTNSSAPIITLYNLYSGEWVKHADPVTPFASSTLTRMSKDGLWVANGRDFASGGQIFQLKDNDTAIIFDTPPGLVTAEEVGTGDGSDATWNLDFTPITGSLVVKLDGATTTDYTLNGTEITFNTAPGVGVVITADYRYTCTITADYTVDGIHKTTTRVIDMTFAIQFGEPT